MTFVYYLIPSEPNSLRPKKQLSLDGPLRTLPPYRCRLKTSILLAALIPPLSRLSGEGRQQPLTTLWWTARASPPYFNLFIHTQEQSDHNKTPLCYYAPKNLITIAPFFCRHPFDKPPRSPQKDLPIFLQNPLS